MNRNLPDSTSNDTIRRAIRAIALKGIVKGSTGAVRGAERTVGYVAKIHTEGELAGTIDVQEYDTSASQGNSDSGVGYHEGVWLSALQDNAKGYVIIPKMYSEVMIAQDPVSQREYVVLFSHVDTIQLDSHDTVSIGVKEREEFDPDDENGPDIDDLEETGVKAVTAYAKNSIVTEVQDENDSDHVRQIINGTQISQAVGDKTSSLLDQNKAEIAHDKGRLSITDSDTVLSQGSSEVKVEDGKVYVGSHTGTQDAVLGISLADILSDLLSLLQSVKVATQLGPQPFLNLPQFVSLRSKIIAYKSSHSGFLTQKVQIQK